LNFSVVNINRGYFQHDGPGEKSLFCARYYFRAIA
jgi:hypothetical protein